MSWQKSFSAIITSDRHTQLFEVNFIEVIVFECPFVVFYMPRLHLLLDISNKGDLVNTNGACAVKLASFVWSQQLFLHYLPVYQPIWLLRNVIVMIVAVNGRYINIIVQQLVLKFHTENALDQQTEDRFEYSWDLLFVISISDIPSIFEKKSK